MNRLKGKFSSEEITWAYKVLASHSQDEETKEQFILTILEKKHKDPDYSIFIDFPRWSEEKLSICREIIASLNGKNNA